MMADITRHLQLYSIVKSFFNESPIQYKISCSTTSNQVLLLWHIQVISIQWEQITSTGVVSK